jgi:hypothetical protein
LLLRSHTTLADPTLSSSLTEKSTPVRQVFREARPAEDVVRERAVALAVTISQLSMEG